MKTKRVISLLMAAAIVVSLCGCQSNPDDSSDTTSEWYEEIIVDDGTGTNSGTVSGGTTSGGTNNGGTNNGGTGNGGTNNGGTNNGGTTSGGSVGNVGHAGTGNKTVDNLDFKGQTFTKTIVGAIPKGLTRRKAAFEKKYNCKIELVSLQWEQYNSQVATRMASGQPYDICGLQNFFFPEAVVQGLYEPLENYVYDADIYNPKTGVGIDLDVSSDFNYKGHMYGVSNHNGAYATMMQVLYYNKCLFEEDDGLEDPLELWKKGQWTWDKMLEMAKYVKEQNNGKYLIGRDFGNTPFITSNAHQYTTVDKNGKVKANLSDPKLTKALTWLKDFYKNYVGPDGDNANPTGFYNGKYYMFSQASSYGTYYMGASITKSESFGKKFSNLGVVPYPYGPDNTKKINVGEGSQAKAAGKGSKDPRIVVAWTKFEREFKDPAAADDPYVYSKEIQKVIDGLFDNVNDRSMNYKTSTNSLNDIYGKAIQAATSGGDFSKVIADNMNTAQSIIDDSLKQK